MGYKWQELKRISSICDINKIVLAGHSTDLINVGEVWQEKKLADIAQQIADRKGIRIILIAGPSSSGKTTTCKKLSLHLVLHEIWPVSISMDDYFLNRENTPRDEKGEYDYESLYAINLDLFNQHLSDLINGKEVELPRYNFMTGKSESSGQRISIEENEVLVIEGIHALNPDLIHGIPKENIFHIFAAPMIDFPLPDGTLLTSTNNRLLRRIIRDYKYRNSTALDTLRRWPSVRAGEKKWILPFKDNADALFNSTMFYEPAVIRKQALPLLSEVSKEEPEYHIAQELIHALNQFEEIPDKQIPPTSLLREFLGGSSFEY